MEDSAIEQTEIVELFECKPAREWLKMSKKISKYPLFGEFWTEGEIAVVFGRTGAGKSIFAVQMGEHLGRGYPIEPFLNLSLTHKVLYLDLERTASQFVRRYSPEMDPETFKAEGKPYEFSKNLIRVEPKHDVRMKVEHIAQMLETTKAKTLVIDNLAYFMKYTIPREAAAVMRDIRRLRDAYGLSVLVVMHAMRSSVRRPLTMADLPCSAAISAAADTVFAIGRCASQSNGRYIKHLRAGARDTAFDGDRVPYFELFNSDGMFPEFEFLSYASEEAALAADNGIWERKRLQEIAAFQAKGKTIREIAWELSMSRSAVHRRIRIIRDIQRQRNEAASAAYDDDDYDDEE